MSRQLEALVRRYRSNGVLVDTNLLVPLIIGRVDPALIISFKRSNRYTPDDYALLELILEGFTITITTPHVLTESSNFLGTLAEPHRQQAFQKLADFASNAREVYDPSVQLSARSTFSTFGLTDTAIIETILMHQCVLLTDDFPLYAHLLTSGIEVMKFSHLRDNF